MKTSLKIRLACFLANLLLLLPAGGTCAQIVYNLNIDNGLPSNYTYCILYDTYGYLWISTQKGVVKYNGYETSLFNYTNGLPEEDVWRLYEDKKRRIWLSSISRQMGYIYNDRYKQIVNLNEKNLYPSEIRDYDDGIFFFSPYQDENIHGQVLYIERNDTLYCKKLEPLLDKNYVKDKNTTVVTRNDSIFILTPDFNINNPASYTNLAFKRKYAPTANMRVWWNSNNILFSEHNSPFIYTGSLSGTKDSIIDFRETVNKREDLQMLFYSDDSYHGKNKFMAMSDKSIYSVDTGLHFRKIAALDSITGQAGATIISYYIENDLWKQCIATFGRGIFIRTPFYEKFRKLPPGPLSDFKYIGRTPGEDCYWWNNTTQTLAQVKSNGTTRYRRYTHVTRVEDITGYTKNTSLLVSRGRIYMMDNRTLQVSNFLENFSEVYLDKKSRSRTDEWDAFKVLSLNPHTVYLLSKASGLYTFDSRKDSLQISNINKDRYNGMIYDSIHNALWVYNADDIEIYRGHNKIYSFGHDALRSLGIKNIEKIIIDSYGNIFLKEYNRLLLFNANTYKFRVLFPNYMMDGVSVNLYRDNLVLAGKFGILFSKINRASNISEEIVYHNIKNTLYNYIKHIQVAGNKVLLSTDKGMYETAIPGENDFKVYPTGNKIRFRLIASYADSLYAVTPGTKIDIDQKDPRLDLDVINPAGNGKVIYQYFIKGVDTNWRETNAGNILLSHLLPGKDYTLLVRVHDDILKSDPIRLGLYIMPYWWQRSVWQNIFWIAGLVLLLTFGYSVAYVTRQRVTRNTAKKNLLLELELKAVYSQINPHFIYNTLSSALLLINNEKMEEAYTHVSKFSRLLRAYVRSSRNKYITVGEEIGNLKNYIELQQTRFKNKFHYEITTAGNGDIESVRIPSLLLQPFVENAINHGLVPKEETGNLSVRFEKMSENELTCIIEDDGIGRKRSDEFKGNRLSESYGDQLIKDLVRIFNTYEKMRIEIQYIDKEEPLAGTIVKIHIKNL